MFWSVWSHSAGLQENRPLKPYMAQTARNAAYSKLRRIKELPIAYDDDILSISHAGNPDELTIQKEQTLSLIHICPRQTGSGKPRREYCCKGAAPVSYTHLLVDITDEKRLQERNNELYEQEIAYFAELSSRDGTFQGRINITGNRLESYISTADVAVGRVGDTYEPVSYTHLGGVTTDEIRVPGVKIGKHVRHQVIFHDRDGRSVGTLNALDVVDVYKRQLQSMAVT